MNFSKINSLNLESDLQQFKKFFEKISSDFELGKNWTHKKVLKNEIIKSFVRGLIRESSFSKNIIHAALNELKNLNYFKDYVFITKAYPMIHLQNDILEAGNFHNDQIGDERMFTCWIPFTDYDYPALSFVNFKKKKYILFNRILNKIKLINYFFHNIFVKKNEIYFWDARIFHKGNINYSENITCAIQFKITNKPFLYERSKKIDLKKPLDSLNYENEFNLSNQSVILNNYKNYLNLVDNLMLIKTDKEYNLEIVNILKNIKKTKITSFALSVLSQRLFMLADRSKEYKKYKFFCRYIDLTSLICGSENLISLERIKETNLFQLFTNSSDSELMKNLPQNSYQWNLILKNKNYILENNFFSF
jgi:hypothetical protein